MYIDYFNEEIDPVAGDQSKIKRTDPIMLVNASAFKTFGKWKIYGGIKNVFNTVQDERHLDDAAFIYAPLFGRILYAGIRIEISR
jgi:outer membrane receptor for ferrienterochelin and colicins